MRLSRLLVSAGAVTALAVPGAFYALGGAAEVRQSSASPAASPSAAPPGQQPPQLSESQVDGALGKLDGVVGNAMRQTGVPGVAVGVVYRDQAVYAKGFGVREVGRPDQVDTGTVFQLASMSKPLASTVVAEAVGRKVADWDAPVVTYDPGFALKDPYVSAHVTVADLFSHRSGLPDHAGDVLEDLGYDGDYIVSHLRLEPLAPFRASYAYTNYGVTAAGNAVASAAKSSWPDLAANTLFKPLGMAHSSYRRGDYEAAADKASAHVRVNGRWQPSTTENADSQAPAGGASSTVDDLTRWIRLQLDNGAYGGKQLVDATALDRTRLPHSIAAPPRAPGGEPGFYGLGWNVNYDQLGRLRLNHSGAFDLGAATTVTLLPTEQLGIVVLTNGQPIGVPEAIAAAFFDIAQNGRQTVDWLALYGKVLGAAADAGASPTDYAKPPASPAPARANSAYTGVYRNDFYGPATVSAAANGQLSLVLGPDRQTFPLTHYTGDTFSYRTRGENAVGLSGVTFHSGPTGTADSVVLENLNTTGLGTFTR
ncbi:serine hydrolase [Streptacidiphilus melanogenes]|uniref:serine hydrolase n=1 Tax=Streptacidiphilus melanogenes TaxID=411235 RepID=UPI0005A7A066|nr:serine hydrolase [Streptacidiphilus melanogenes]